MSFIHSLYLCTFIKATMCLHYFKRERKVVTEYPLMLKALCLYLFGMALLGNPRALQYEPTKTGSV